MPRITLLIRVRLRTQEQQAVYSTTLSSSPLPPRRPPLPPHSRPPSQACSSGPQRHACVCGSCQYSRKHSFSSSPAALPARAAAKTRVAPLTYEYTHIETHASTCDV